MSELKAYGIRGIDGLVVESESGQLYLKDEADKVIANRDYEIEELKKSIGRLLKAKTEQVIDEVMQKTLIYGEGFVRVEDAMKLIAELRHQKYKRCLAMANVLTCEHNYLVDFVSSDFPNIRFKRKHKLKWMNKWLELAEQFKEEK